MYLWKIRNLKQDIKENKVTKKSKLFYLFFFTLLYVALLIQSSIQIDSLWNIEMVILQIVISLLGLGYIYYRNEKVENFVFHLTSVGWVFLLRSLFFMSIGMLNLYVMTHLFGVAELFSAKNAIIVGMGFELLLYWRIGSHIGSLKS